MVIPTQGFRTKGFKKDGTKDLNGVKKLEVKRHSMLLGLEALKKLQVSDSKAGGDTSDAQASKSLQGVPVWVPAPPSADGVTGEAFHKGVVQSVAAQTKMAKVSWIFD